jgi:hypothetical protein
MIDRLTDHAAPSLLYGASFVATLASWQENLEWALKIAASLTAIGCAIAGYLVTRRRVRRDRD